MSEQNTETAIDLERTANLPVSEGVHTFVIIEETETMGPSGYAYWAFTCVPETSGEENKTARFGVSTGATSRWRMEQFLDAVNAPKAGAAKIHQFHGRRFRATVEHRDYEGRAQADLKDLYPPTAPAVRVAAMPPQESAPEPVTTKAPPPPATITRRVAGTNGNAPAAKTAPAGKTVPAAKTITKTAPVTRNNATEPGKGKPAGKPGKPTSKLPADATSGEDIPF